MLSLSERNDDGQQAPEYLDNVVLIVGNSDGHVFFCVQFKTLLIKIVLATDMSNHFEIVATFQQKFSGLSDDNDEDSQPSRKTIADNSALIIQMIVKAADLGHCYARVEQHLYWSKCLEDEFFKQGDSERTLDIAISPLMDRNKPGDEAILCAFSCHASAPFQVSIRMGSYICRLIGCHDADCDRSWCH